MNIKTSVLFLALLPLFTVAQDKLTITGKVKGITEGTLVSLTDVNKPADTLAKGNVKNGVFVLQQELKEPMLVNINMAPGKSLMTFLDNSKVKITGDLAQVQEVKVTGCS